MSGGIRIVHVSLAKRLCIGVIAILLSIGLWLGVSCGIILIESRMTRLIDPHSYIYLAGIMLGALLGLMTAMVLGTSWGEHGLRAAFKAAIGVGAVVAGMTVLCLRAGQGTVNLADIALLLSVAIYAVAVVTDRWCRRRSLRWSSGVMLGLMIVLTTVTAMVDYRVNHDWRDHGSEHVEASLLIIGVMTIYFVIVWGQWLVWRWVEKKACPRIEK